MGHHGHHHVQLKVAGHPADGDGRVVADNLGGYHGHRFGDYRINLAGHDGGAGLNLGQENLPDPAARSGAQPANVIGDFHQAYRDGFQGPAGFHISILGGLGLEVIFRFPEVNAGQHAEPFANLGRKFRMGVNSGAHRGAADGQFPEMVAQFFQTAHSVGNLAGVAAEFLPQTDGGGVLEVGAPDLDDLVEFVGFGFQNPVQVLQGHQQIALDRFQSGQVHGGGNHVVAGLPHVDVVVGMHGMAIADFPAQEFVGAIGKHLIGVHVGGGSRTGLEDVHHKLVIQLTFHHLFGGFFDSVRQGAVQLAKFFVGAGRRQLQHAQGPDIAARESEIADRKIFNSALSLGSPISRIRDSHFPHGVLLNTKTITHYASPVCSSGREAGPNHGSSKSLPPLPGMF